ncbi:hypothetical protein KPH14_013109, partial [Odynerus spinipes]
MAITSRKAQAREPKTLGELLYGKVEHLNSPKKSIKSKELVTSTASDAIDGVAQRRLDDLSKKKGPTVSPPPSSPSLSVLLLSNAAPDIAQPATVTSRATSEQAVGVATNRELLDLANVAAFDTWNHMVLQNNWILVGSEYSVSYEKAGIAGTLDAIFIPHAENPNQWVIVDWKRCPLEFSRYSPTPYEHPYAKR